MGGIIYTNQLESFIKFHSFIIDIKSFELLSRRSLQPSLVITCSYPLVIHFISPFYLNSHIVKLETVFEPLFSQSQIRIDNNLNVFT